MRWQYGVVVAFMMVGAAHILRASAVRAGHSSATVLWPEHPEVLARNIMLQVAKVAVAGKTTLSPTTLHGVQRLAAKEPLSPDPYLIQGALAQIRRDEERAFSMYEKARSLDPRSEAARYFLAEAYMRRGRAADALTEIAVLARILPGSVPKFGPALAAYAEEPGAVPVLRAAFKTAPELYPIVMSELARHAKTKLISALAGAEPPSLNTDAAWKSELIRALVERQRFREARSVWARFYNVDSSAALFNPGFRDLTAPAPFNWHFPLEGGLAEPQAGGLQVVHFGRQNSVLAEQLLLLPAGTYKLSSYIRGSNASRSSLAWVIACVSSNQEVFQLDLRTNGAAGVVEGTFKVPTACEAQHLRLIGMIGDTQATVEIFLTGLKLTRVLNS